MRRALDGLYMGAAWLAGLAMIGVLVMVLTGIVSREIGVNVPGTDSYAGYFMAAAGFLALAHTLKRGEHIRVTLVLSFLKGSWHRRFELWSLGMATALAASFAFFSTRLAWQSYLYHDVSTGNDATPLWIPQIAFSVGAIVLFIAFVDELVLEIRGQRPAPGTDAGQEALHNE